VKEKINCVDCYAVASKLKEKYARKKEAQKELRCVTCAAKAKTRGA
jgi:hypothetical protein